MRPGPDERRSALVSLDAKGAVVGYRSCSGDDELIEACLSMGPGECTVGIDAPLVVPADTAGIRDCEVELMRRGIPVMPADPERFRRWYGGCRGVALVEELRALGAGHELVAELPTRARGAVVEVYPTGSWMRIFGERPRFKNVRRAAKSEALLGLQDMLEARLPEGYPPVRLGRLRRERRELEGMGHAGLNLYGDALDALMAAYTVLLWRRDPSLCEVVGTKERGFIVLPRRPQGKRADDGGDEAREDVEGPRAG